MTIYKVDVTIQFMDKTQAVKWIEHSIGHELEDGHQRCVNVLAQWRAVYNIHPVEGWDFQKFGERCSLRIVIQDSLATYDFDGLTSLVLAAHKYAVRVSLGAVLDAQEKHVERLKEEYGEEVDHWYNISRQAYLEIQLHARDSEPTNGYSYDYHPGLDKLERRVRLTANPDAGRVTV